VPGQDGVTDWKHCDVAVSQQFWEPDGAAGQVLWHWALVVHLEGQVMASPTPVPLPDPVSGAPVS